MPVPELQSVIETIDQWFQDQIRCGPIAQHTPAYNQAATAQAVLKERIAALFPAPESDNAQQHSDQPLEQSSSAAEE